MPNAITSSGLETATQTELLANMTAALQAIYGSDITLDPDSPDGQMVNLFIQSIIDMEDLLTQIYNGFDPDLALGVVLDQRVALNGIQRKAGTFTVTNISITTTQALTLQGLDLYPDAPYTVADGAGNQWELLLTQTPGGSGTFVYAFQAVNPGAVLTTINTINVPVSVVIGVSAINNPTTYTTLGLNEETDAQLKIRRQKSVSIGSQGYLQSLLAALNNINTVSTAIVYENTTDTTDIFGLPSHSINVIVNSGADEASVAQAIYQKRNAGCGMFGATSYTITQVDGSPFPIKFDYVVPEDLYIQFDVHSIDGIHVPLTAQILAQLPTLFAPGVGATVNATELGTLVQEIDPNSLVTVVGFGSGGFGAAAILTPTARNHQFDVSSPNISITVV